MKMLLRQFNKLHTTKYHFVTLPVRNSALFINGLKATDTYVFVQPHIEYLECTKDKEKLKTQLKRRKSEYDLNKLDNLWKVYQDLNQRKLDYEAKKSDISRELSKIINTESDSDAVKQYKLKIDLIKDNLRKLKLPLWSAEEQAILEYLKIPNTIHHLAPDEQSKIIYTNLTQSNNKTTDHLAIGRKLNIIDFKKNENYYLKGDAAVFELGAKIYFSKILKDNNFVQFSNPDFVKSVIIEGCGEDHTNSDSTFILHHHEGAKVNVDSRLHLTGGGSLPAFMANYSKNIIHAKNLPFKCFSMGRQYIPSTADEDSLFHVSQSSVVQVFEAAKDPEELDRLLEQTIDIVTEAYRRLGYHFRLSLVPADKLLMWESLRVSIEMYSTSMGSYVEVGNLSVSGDFISKRLMFTYTDRKESKFPSILSGTLLNVPKFLACVLEQDADFKVPEYFEVKNWSL